MVDIAERFLEGVGCFFIIYLLIYTSYLFLSVVVGAWQLYQRELRSQVSNELKHDYYLPVSILVPAYNEEVTIADSIKSLLNLDYRLYEIIVIDDGSSDNTVKEVVETFGLEKVERPIHMELKCRPQKAIWEGTHGRISITLISKENGGKGDALNMGINASKFPYFLCLDADSMLQRDSLEKIAQPLLEDDTIVAVGGLIHVAQCVKMEKGEVLGYHLSMNPIISMQVVEYERSFLASRILMDGFNGNLIISGAFGLFKKDVVVEAGGYDTETLGEDMELVVKLHVYCRNNKRPYCIRYEPNACCWSQAPGSLRDLMKQRRRWYLGLFQSMVKYRAMLANPRFGCVGTISYIYYFIFELLSPLIECFGAATMILAGSLGLLNWSFMVQFFLLYGIYGAVLTLTAFFQRIYTQNLKISLLDLLKAVAMCFLENIFFRYVLSFVRMTALFNYRKKRKQWGSIKRVKAENMK